MQTNRQNGINQVAVAQGKKPPLPLVGLHAGGSPNQKVEAPVVQIGLYGLVQQDDAKCLTAARRLIELLDMMLSTGHMLIEPATDSHAPIWLRAMIAARLYSMQLGKRGGLYETLDNLVVQWHRQHITLLQMGAVSSGPLTEWPGKEANIPTVLLPCARKSGIGGKKKGPISGGPESEPGNMVRDIYFQSMTNAPLRPTGRDFWQLNAERQDTAAAPLLRMVQARGGWDLNFDQSAALGLCQRLKVSRHTDGHYADFPDGLPGCRDASVSCWVHYPTGTWSFSGPNNHLDRPAWAIDKREETEIPKAAG
jgi:hypothetical protein